MPFWNWISLKRKSLANCFKFTYRLVVELTLVLLRERRDMIESPQLTTVPLLIENVRRRYRSSLSRGLYGRSGSEQTRGFWWSGTGTCIEKRTIVNVNEWLMWPKIGRGGGNSFGNGRNWRCSHVNLISNQINTYGREKNVDIIYCVGWGAMTVRWMNLMGFVLCVWFRWMEWAWQRAFDDEFFWSLSEPTRWGQLTNKEAVKLYAKHRPVLLITTETGHPT